MKIIRTIINILVVLFGIYVYPDLQALFEKAQQFITISGSTFSLQFTYMGLLWLAIAIILVVLLPKLWKKVNILKIPAQLVASLSLGYIIGFVVYLF